MTSIPPDAQRLADRLRHLAGEVESAARFGVPIPDLISVDAREHACAASFSADEREFAAWAGYTEAKVTYYRYEGRKWSRAVGDLNDLRVEFAVQHEATKAAS